jgi:hypothetical protein
VAPTARRRGPRAAYGVSARRTPPTGAVSAARIGGRCAPNYIVADCTSSEKEALIAQAARYQQCASYGPAFSLICDNPRSADQGAMREASARKQRGAHANSWTSSGRWSCGTTSGA